MKGKRFVVIFIMMIIVLNLTTSISNAQNRDIDYMYKESIDTNPQGIPSKTEIILQGLKTLLYWYHNNYSIQTEPYIQYYSDFYVSNHESVHFNVNGNYPTVVKEVKAFDRDIIRPYMQKNHFLIGKKVIISIFDDRHNILESETVGSGISIDYSPRLPRGVDNDYYIHFSCSDNLSWIPRVIFVPHNESTRGGGGDTHLTNDEYDNQVVIKGDRILLRNQDNQEYYSRITSNKVKHSFDELMAKFFDFKNYQITDQCMGHQAGDKFIVSDRIKDITYSLEEEYTSIYFNSNILEEDHIIRFKGDITDNFSKDDVVDFEFELVKIDEYNGEEFVDIDYNTFVNEKQDFPEINDFLFE